MLFTAYVASHNKRVIINKCELIILGKLTFCFQILPSIRLHPADDSRNPLVILFL